MKEPREIAGLFVFSVVLDCLCGLVGLTCCWVEAGEWAETERGAVEAWGA